MEIIDLNNNSVNNIIELVNANYSTLHYIDKKPHLIIDGKRAEITNWILDRVLMASTPDPLNLRDDLSLLG
tara:strand:- start:396 stop:608 length:213 start_codon:yes stop_codon:yes gene_type:complete